MAERRSIHSGFGPQPRRIILIFRYSAAASSSVRWPRPLGRIADPGALSGRLHQHGAGTALRAGVLPGRLLTGRSRAAFPAQQRRLELPEKVAIQLNDTHPAMAVPELMRILLDDAQLGWDQAWDITRKTLAYTNHTLLPEALEKWPLAWFEINAAAPLEIIYEINRRLLDEVRTRFPGDEGRVAAREPGRGGRAAQDSDGQPGDRRLAQHQRRGRDSLRTAAHDNGQGPGRDVPERFNNKTNGVTPRRWLLLSNPALAR